MPVIQRARQVQAGGPGVHGREFQATCDTVRQCEKGKEGMGVGRDRKREKEGRRGNWFLNKGSFI